MRLKYMDRSAEFDATKTYRYLLLRFWDMTMPRAAVFLMFNPSDASAVKDDPTIRRCVGFSNGFGCGRLIVVNMFAFVSTDPAGLLTTADPVGPDNDATIRRVLTEAKREEAPVIAAWGGIQHPLKNARVGEMHRLFGELGTKVECLGRTKDGSPVHPVRLARSTLRQHYWTA